MVMVMMMMMVAVMVVVMVSGMRTCGVASPKSTVSRVFTTQAISPTPIAQPNSHASLVSTRGEALLQTDDSRPTTQWRMTTKVTTPAMMLALLVAPDVVDESQAIGRHR